MRSLRALLPVLLLVAAGAEARNARPKARSTATDGLGRNCQKNSDCRGRTQRCLKESDANGKDLPQGFCVLPCASFEAGTTKVIAGQGLDPAQAKTQLKKKAPPRCPAHYQCRSAGSGVPIDMCVKE